MVKVKKTTDNSENVSKERKKSLGAVHSIKSPNSRRKSSATVLPTPLKPQKNKGGKSIDVAFTITKIDEVSPVKEKSKFQKKERLDIKSIGDTSTGNNKFKNATFKDLSNKYNINIEDVKSAVKGVIQLQLENPKIKNQLFDDERFPLSLMINCHKIPRGHHTILRIPLRNSLLTPEDEVCLIVSEVKGIGNKEHEKHVEHYEELLSKKGVTNINKIMTIHELKTEYETFEQKARLVDLYDVFLACGKVSGKVVKRCGKIFYKKRKVPISVKLQSTKLKEHIDKQLSKAFLHLHLRGDSYNVEFGHSKMDVSEIVENFGSVVEFLAKEFPGGFENIKGLHVSAPRATSIPVYLSIKNPMDIPKVRVKGPNKKFMLKATKGELTTLPDAEVLVKPTGQVIVTRGKGNEDVDKITLRDIENDIRNRKSNKEDTGEPRKKLKSRKKKSVNAGEEIVKKKNKNNEGETADKEVLRKKLKLKKNIQNDRQDTEITDAIVSAESEKRPKKKKSTDSEKNIGKIPAKQAKENFKSKKLKIKVIKKN